MPGELECGDAWATAPHASGARIVVADGLGHGAEAAEAAREAVGVFHKRAADEPATILRFAHEALRSTRGAAVSVVDVDCDRGVITFAGIGNIAGAALIGSSRRNFVSHNGILGHAARTISAFTYPFDRNTLVVLNSDGLVTHWSLDAYPGIVGRDPSVIAAVLYRDFTRRRDDVTVVVARQAA